MGECLSTQDDREMTANKYDHPSLPSETADESSDSDQNELMRHFHKPGALSVNAKNKILEYFCCDEDGNSADASKIKKVPMSDFCYIASAYYGCYLDKKYVDSDGHCILSDIMEQKERQVNTEINKPGMFSPTKKHITKRECYAWIDRKKCEYDAAKKVGGAWTRPRLSSSNRIRHSGTGNIKAFGPDGTQIPVLKVFKGKEATPVQGNRLLLHPTFEQRGHIKQLAKDYLSDRLGAGDAMIRLTKISKTYAQSGQMPRSVIEQVARACGSRVRFATADDLVNFFFDGGSAESVTSEAFQEKMMLVKEGYMYEAKPRKTRQGSVSRSDSTSPWEMSLTTRRLAQVSPCDPCHALGGNNPGATVGAGCVIFGLLLLLLVFRRSTTPTHAEERVHSSRLGIGEI